MKHNEMIDRYQSTIDSPIFPTLSEAAQKELRELLQAEIDKQTKAEKQEIMRSLLNYMQELMKDSDIELSLLVTHDSDKTIGVREYYPPVEEENDEDDEDEGWVMESNNIGVPDMFEGIEDEPAAEEETAEVEPQRKKKKKSVGFSVSFGDGTVIHERKAVHTWIKTLQKIGLDNIINNQRKHKAWHKVGDRQICIVDRVETVRTTDNVSPQSLIDGYYVMIQLSNTQKVNDIESLAKLWPKLKIKVTWDEPLSAPSEDEDDGNQPAHPKINEEAKFYNFPIKEQARMYMGQHVMERTANSYISVLDNAVRGYISEKIDSDADSVFSYTTVEDVEQVIELLNSDDEFIEENERRHNSMTAALNQYLKFIKSRE